MISTGTYFRSRVYAMRFSIGLLLGILIGASVTVAYYEFWNPDVEEPMEGSDSADR